MEIMFMSAGSREPAKVLIASHAAAPQCKLKTVYKKYCSQPFGCVALHNPAIA
jgi:cyclin B